MMRHDIGFHDGHPKVTDADKYKPLRFFEEDGFVFTAINDQAELQYDRQAWEKSRLNYLDKCIEMKANIVCLGEFDFPPVQSEVDDGPFLENVEAKIAGVPFPMFVLFGTRHEKTNDHPMCCKNVAKIVVNKELKNTVKTHKATEFVYEHEKIVPATKVGEILSPPQEIRAKYYDTKLGRIAVLICRSLDLI